MSRRDEVNPDFRRNAKAGEGMTDLARKQKRRSDPDKARHDKMRSAERLAELGEDERERRAARNRERQTRFRENNNMALRCGGLHNFSAWLEVYKHRQSEPSDEVNTTLEAFKDRGFRVVKQAVAEEELQEIHAEVERTVADAENYKKWRYSFSGIDRAGRIRSSSDRQMAEIRGNGDTRRTAQVSVNKYLGEMENVKLIVGKVSLLDTLSATPQPDHSDYPFGQASTWKARFPVACILAIEEGSIFSTFDCALDEEDPHGQRTSGSRVEVALDAGDLVLFHGATVHRGAAYPSRNRRIHFYVIPERFKEPGNETYLIREQVA